MSEGIKIMPAPELNRFRPVHFDVLYLVSQGMTHAEISPKIGYAKTSIRDFTKEIRGTLGAKNMAHAVDISIMNSILGIVLDSEEGSFVEMPSAELEVLNLAAHGLTHSEAGNKRHRGYSTIHTQCGFILRRLGARNMVHAIRRGHEAGILPLDEAKRS